MQKQRKTVTGPHRAQSKAFSSSSQTSLVAQAVKNPPAMQETWARSLPLPGVDPLEKGTVAHYSGLENSMDKGSCQATAHGVGKSWT